MTPLTAKEVITHTGRSEETIRRQIRSVRAQYLVELDDTNQQVREKRQAPCTCLRLVITEGSVGGEFSCGG